MWKIKPLLIYVGASTIRDIAQGDELATPYPIHQTAWMRNICLRHENFGLTLPYQANEPILCRVAWPLLL